MRRWWRWEAASSREARPWWAGLGLNALFGWWWADPVAALAMVPIIGREGVAALRGEVCTDCHLDLTEKGEDGCGTDACGCG